MGAAKKVVVEPHRHAGVFVARSKNDDLLLTRNLVPGDTVYNEKKIQVDVSFSCKVKDEERLIWKFRGRMARKSSTEYGIHLGLNWVLLFWVVLIKFT